MTSIKELKVQIEHKKSQLQDLTSAAMQDGSAANANPRFYWLEGDISRLEAKLARAISKNSGADEEDGSVSEDTEDLEEGDESDEQETTDNSDDEHETQNNQESDSLGNSTSDIRREGGGSEAELAQALNFEPAKSDERNVDHNAQSPYRSEDEGDEGGNNAQVMGGGGDIFV